MLDQARRLRPFIQQRPCVFARVSHALLCHPPQPGDAESEETALESGQTSLFQPVFAAVVEFSLDNSRRLRALFYKRQVPSRRTPALAPPQQLMATSMAPVQAREVLRCDHCSLVQFRTLNSLCRRCHKPLEIEEPESEASPLSLVPPQTEHKGGLQVAQAVRDLRRSRNLSQRQLAARMNVPRTYISKIENAKATPTLSSLERLASALEVDITALLRDPAGRQQEELSILMRDPFMAEVAAVVAKLDGLQRSIFMNHVREMAAGHRRTA